ncbi:MAG TPA: DUF1109 domain-containing protein [Burkholderiaceae bacterium]|nr:DUF1109 domain-containing protein [Burkholderiaceae bacterium]
MKTDELIAMLAAGPTAVDSRAYLRRFATALGWAAFGGMLLMAIFLGVRPDLAQAASVPMFWVKLGFGIVLAAAGVIAAARLGRPGARTGIAGWLVAAPIALLWLGAVLVLIQAEPGERMALVLGQTWRECPWNIALLSVPAFAASFWALRGLAPTRLRIAGAVAGLLAGSIGATVYALHCPELAAPFLAVWYVLGIALTTAVGALLGPRLLRW